MILGFYPNIIMMPGSKGDIRIAPRFALPQSSPIFAIRGAPAPLLAHIGDGHKATPPQESKLSVGSGF